MAGLCPRLLVCTGRVKPRRLENRDTVGSDFAIKPRVRRVDIKDMKREHGGLTPYLASLLRLGGPCCERDFLGHEHRSLLRGAPPASAAGLRGRMENPDEPEPAPRILHLQRRAA